MSIFKPGDIRGLYPDEINEDVAYKIGLYFSKFARGKILVGGDFRRGTLSLKEYLIRGLANSPYLKIFDLGQTTTPIFYFASRFIKSDWGIMVTASHNPPEYNGMKIIKGIFPIEDEQLKEIENNVNSLFVKEYSPQLYYKPELIDIEDEYFENLKKNLGNIPFDREIIFDIGNGAVGKIIDRLINEFRLNATCLFKEPNPDFPSRNPNPALKESLIILQDEIKKRKDAIGFAFDGDGDRLAIVDENAQIVQPDIVAAILIDSLANKNDRIVFDIKSSSLVKKTILKKNGFPIMERSGYPFIKKTFVEKDALLATEISGHYFFREILQDDAVYASLKFLKILDSRSLYLLRNDYKLPYISPDIRVKMDSNTADLILKELKDNLEGIIEIDGVYKEFENGFGLVRKSITEPLLTLRFEGKDKDDVYLIINEFLKKSSTLQEYESIIRKSIYII
jgi:phosphomannomutase/phosphoglucomutase